MPRSLSRKRCVGLIQVPINKVQWVRECFGDSNLYQSLFPDEGTALFRVYDAATGKFSLNHAGLDHARMLLFKQKIPANILDKDSKVLSCYRFTPEGEYIQQHIEKAMGHEGPSWKNQVEYWKRYQLLQLLDS